MSDKPSDQATFTEIRCQVVKAGKFILLDGRGEPRGRLGVNEDGSSSLVLIDQKGNYRAWIGLKEDGSGFVSLKSQMGRISFWAPEAADDSRRAEAAPAGDGGQPTTEKMEEPARPAAAPPEPAAAPAPAVKAADGAESQPLLGRLERLERQNRRLKFAGLAVLVLLLAAVTGLGYLVNLSRWRPPAPTTLAAQALVVNRADGSRGAWLGEQEGAVRLTLYDGQGRVRLALGLAANGEPAMQLYDQQQILRAELGLDSGGEPGAGLLDQAGLLRVALGKVKAKGQVGEDILADRPLHSLVLINQEGVPVWRAPQRWHR